MIALRFLLRFSDMLRGVLAQKFIACFGVDEVQHGWRERRNAKSSQIEL